MLEVNKRKHNFKKIPETIKITDILKSLPKPLFINSFIFY